MESEIGWDERVMFMLRALVDTWRDFDAHLAIRQSTVMQALCENARNKTVAEILGSCDFRELRQPPLLLQKEWKHATRDSF